MYCVCVCVCVCDNLGVSMTDFYSQSDVRNDYRMLTVCVDMLNASLPFKIL